MVTGIETSEQCSESRHGDQYRRSAELLHQTRRDDADDSRMPGFVRQNDRVLFFEIHGEYALARLLERRMIDLLAAVIQLFQLAGDDVGLVLILREQ